MSSDLTMFDFGLISLGFQLPLLHDGLYCEVYRLPALVGLRSNSSGLSTNVGVDFLHFFLEYSDAHEGQQSIVKRIRLNCDGGVQTGFSHMLAVLSNVRAATPTAFEHRYIAAFDILDADEMTPFGPQSMLVLVTPFYCQGNILSYGSECSQACKLSLLIQAAQALEHLHHYDVVHGHIYPGNMYITDTGRATLADALVYTLACQFILHPHKTIPLQNSSIYQAPELLWPSTDVYVPPAKSSDVYAFASVIYAVFTGNPPFQGSSHRTLERVVAEILIHGHLRIRRPSNDIMGDNLWDLLQRCWALDVGDRPTMDAVVTALEDVQLYD